MAIQPDIRTIGLFDQLRDARKVLVAGAGGGFDVYCGLPLYFGLRDSGVEVHLANLSFVSPQRSDAAQLADSLYVVTADTSGPTGYFPEQHLAEWFRERGEEIPIYVFPQTGVAPLIDAYAALARRLDLDAVVLVDGGTDSLARGDEFSLGTPEEDMASLAAVHALDVPTRILTCVGFGIDTYHGICHAQYLEAVADLARQGAFLGAFSVLRDMPQARLYVQAVRYACAQSPGRESIVNTSLASAIEGHYGDHHATPRTAGSKLWINPLMGLYWVFDLPAVVKRSLYIDQLVHTQSYADLQIAVDDYRCKVTNRKDWESIPV